VRLHVFCALPELEFALSCHLGYPSVLCALVRSLGTAVFQGATKRQKGLLSVTTSVEETYVMLYRLECLTVLYWGLNSSVSLIMSMLSIAPSHNMSRFAHIENYSSSCMAVHMAHEALSVFQSASSQHRRNRPYSVAHQYSCDIFHVCYKRKGKKKGKNPSSKLATKL
jgi:hypothetical protein